MRAFNASIYLFINSDAYNAIGLDPQFTGLWREATVETTIVQGKYGNTDLPNIKVKPGDRIYASFKNAHLNVRTASPPLRIVISHHLPQPADFENPKEVNPSRKEKYRLNGTGFHNCPGVNFAEQTITEIVKAVFGLRNVRRAPGNAGSLKGFEVTINETKTNMYLSSTGKLTPWPESMHLVVC
jgi:linoleate 10R-lipoxygenase